jgi:hypothetical protein
MIAASLIALRLIYAISVRNGFQLTCWRGDLRLFRLVPQLAQTCAPRASTSRKEQRKRQNGGMIAAQQLEELAPGSVAKTEARKYSRPWPSKRQRVRC